MMVEQVLIWTCTACGEKEEIREKIFSRDELMKAGVPDMWTDAGSLGLFCWKHTVKVNIEASKVRKPNLTPYNDVPIFKMQSAESAGGK